MTHTAPLHVPKWETYPNFRVPTVITVLKKMVHGMAPKKIMEELYIMLLSPVDYMY
jgi:hypothetical protein